MPRLTTGLCILNWMIAGKCGPVLGSYDVVAQVDSSFFKMFLKSIELPKVVIEEAVFPVAQRG